MADLYGDWMAELDVNSFSYLNLIGQSRNWTPTVKPRLVTTSGNVNPLDGLVRVDATAGAVTMTLETAVGADGRIHHFKKIDASGNAMTLASSEGIDGAATKATTTQYVSFTLMSNGVGWDVL